MKISDLLMATQTPHTSHPVGAVKDILQIHIWQRPNRGNRAKHPILHTVLLVRASHLQFGGCRACYGIPTLRAPHTIPYKPSQHNSSICGNEV